ncbi:unnamed protein product, partial [Allacma fusca]
LCGITKVLLSSLSGVLPPNLHFETPNPELIPILDGRIKIVTEFSADQRPQNSFPEAIPKVLFASGRTPDAVRIYLEKALKFSEDPDALSLLHEIVKTEIPRHSFCGFAISRDGKPIVQVEEKNLRNSIWFMYTGLGSQWIGMSKDMMKFEAFQKSIYISIEIMKNNGFDLKSILDTDNLELLNDLKNALVSITSIQVALTDLLATLSIRPDGIIGHSNGESACAYADKCLTQEQTLLVALSKARGFLEADLNPATLASIGMSLKELEPRCPADIYPAIHNTENNITVAGPFDSIRT